MNTIELKINEMYKTNAGWLVPRSHLKGGKGEKYAVVEVITGGDSHYAKRHLTYTTSDFRKALELAKNERITII